MLSLEYICEICEQHKEAFNAQVEEFKIGDKSFNFNSQKSILGIVNLSTESWYKNSICYNLEQVIRRAKVLTIQGADIIDIGAESTVQTTERVDAVKQNRQILPILETLSQEGVLTSIETYYPEVARACLKAGANVINFTGKEKKEEMYQVVSEFDAGIIICYIQGKNARALGNLNIGEDPIGLVYDYFAKEVEIAAQFGVRKIFLDPAIGLSYANLYKKQDYSFRVQYQIKTLLNSFRLRKLGFPICNHLPSSLEVFAEEFRTAQPVIAVMAILGKNDLMRTHEVAKVKAVLDILSLF